MEDPFAGSAQASVNETGASRALAAAAASVCKSCLRVIMEPTGEERKNKKEQASWSSRTGTVKFEVLSGAS
jgi:hypothetical protein